MNHEYSLLGGSLKVFDDFDFDNYSIEFIPDVYEAILDSERKGLLTILRFEELNEDQLNLIKTTITNEYNQAVDHPEYRHFLIGQFPDIIEENQ